jgi:endoplasmic reticulum lectin 1
MKTLMVIGFVTLVASSVDSKEENGGLGLLASPSLNAKSDNQVSAFDDTVLYKIKFNEDDKDDDHSLPQSVSNRIKGLDKIDILTLNEDEESENILWIQTKNQETYYCVIPSLNGDQELETTNELSEKRELLEPVSPYHLLKPLIERKLCSYRLEQYWTYELCHGRFLRQFHEESVVSKKTAKGQEYILGKFDAAVQFSVAEKEFNEKLAQLKEKGMKPPSISIEGNNLPYIEFNYTSGTLCDINNKPRTTRVFYVCSDNAKHEIYSIKEIFTCEYEAIVLSPVLCLNKHYQKKSLVEHDIRCFPVGEKTPSKPKDVEEFEAGIRAPSKADNIFDGKTVIFDSAEITPDGVRIQVQIHDPDQSFENLWNPTKNIFIPSPLKSKFMKNRLSATKIDASLIAEFLSGDLCLHGVSCFYFDLDNELMALSELNRVLVGGSTSFVMVRKSSNTTKRQERRLPKSC